MLGVPTVQLLLFHIRCYLKFACVYSSFPKLNGSNVILDFDWLHGAGALAFDVEYARWTEEQNKLINELRTAVNSHASDTELRTIVDNVTTHFNDVFRLKTNAAKADVFHILSGMWKTPAERCFMWLGGFRPSELLKVRPFVIGVAPFSPFLLSDGVLW